MLWNILIIFLSNLVVARGAWNISSDGFLLNSLKYSNIRNTDYFSIVFSTKQHNGILLFCTGGENYLLLELYHAVLRLSVNYVGQVQQEPYIGYVGSGLADDFPHQVEIYRQPNSVMLVLDRGKSNALVSWPVFSSSELVFKIDHAFVGGYPRILPMTRKMSLSETGFSGCIEVAIWNNVNLLYDPYANASVNFCQKQTFKPISFLSPQSYMLLNRQPQASGLSLVFDIMVYLGSTTILLHKDNTSTLNISIVEGKLFVSLDYVEINYITAFLPQIKINDGRWHRIILQLPGKGSLQEPIAVFGVDNEIVTTLSSFSYDTTRDIKFGGYGFVGCINNLVVDGISMSLHSSTERFNVTMNGCLFPNQCVPNPCQHSGICDLKPNNFACTCPSSYPGEVCDDALYYFSCAHMFACGKKDSGKQFIDTDGVGPYDPVGVLCNNMEDAAPIMVTTQVDNLLPFGKITIKNEPTTVDIPYALSFQELRLLVLNSKFCYQQVTYECSFSKITENNSSLLVWIGGDGDTHQYWNEQLVYSACQCWVDNRKCYQNKRCNCDDDDRMTKHDSVTFSDKFHLPIVGITAMDISSSTGKSATVEVGPLMCSGIGGEEEAASFQETFSYMPIPTINFASPGTIEFIFKTDRTQGNVVIFAQGRPNTEYYAIELTNSTAVTVHFSLGSTKFTLAVQISSKMPVLDNLGPHTIYFKINQKIAYLSVDMVAAKMSIPYDFQTPIQVNKDNTPFFVGGSPYHMFSGFKGTVTSLRINGEFINLVKLSANLDARTFGVHSGTKSACLSYPNVCNYGECVDHFSYYMCDCSISPYYGQNCETEVGVSFNAPSSSLTYYFANLFTWVQYIIIISFRTTSDGLLYMIRGDDTNVFIMMDIYQGSVRLRLNFWKKRTLVPNEYRFPASLVHSRLTDGKTHVVQLRFRDYYYRVLIDGFPQYFTITTNDVNDLFFVNPQWVYLGTSPAIQDYPSVKARDFSGCMGGMKIKFYYNGGKDYDSVDILRALGSGSTNTKTIGVGVSSGVCVGNLSAAPAAPLISTPANMIPGGGAVLSPIGTGISSALPQSPTNSWTPVLVACLILLGFMLILGGLLFLRWYSRNHGVYVTQEGERLVLEADRIQTKTKERPSTALPKAIKQDSSGWYL